MKRALPYFVIVAACVLAACTRNFDKINTDPAKSSATNFDPNYLFTNVAQNYANVSEFQLYELSCMMQVFSSTLDYYSGGDKYTTFLLSYNNRFFSDGLLGASQLVELKSLALQRDPAKYANLVCMSDILFVLVMQRVTDVYGDVPYFQVGMAKQGIQLPAYDAQQDIYHNMLGKLDSAITGLDAARPLATGDLLYGGAIDKWQRLGYSLMVRVAMRLSKADPATAQLYVEKAAGKTFTGTADDAIVKFDRGVNQYNQLALDLPQVRWSQTFIDFLRAGNDPRLYTLTEKPDTGLASNSRIRAAGLGYTTASPAPAGYVQEVPVGMPNGYDIGGVHDIAAAPGYPGPTGSGTNASPLGNYARPKVTVFGVQVNVPVNILSYAQTELLLAEAAVRGWKAGGVSAAAHFKNGITAALQSQAAIDPTLAIPAEVITAYGERHPLNTAVADSALKMINTQYWAACLLDFAESWSNYRRSGYPALTPVLYPGNITNGAIPRRLTYPLSENALNHDQYQAALQRMGGTDVNTARVWWDVP